MRRTENGSIFVLALALAVGACGAQGSGQQDSDSVGVESRAEQLQALDHDLTPGASGDLVQALHEYLARYGYLPNEALARSYPAWRPIVADGPADVAVYDENTSAAVRALQTNAGLEPNGLVDEPTRDLLRLRRCDVPDGITRPDPSQKFAHGPSTWGGSTLTWKLIDTNLINVTKARAAAVAAFASWAAQTSLTFTQVGAGSAADIEIRVAPMDGRGVQKIAFGAFPGDGGDVTLDSDEPWSLETNTPSGTYDFQTILLHELGHSLGLEHSGEGLEQAIMFGAYRGQRRSLTLEDNVSISAIYDTWELLPGLANDVGVGADGTAWIVGTNAMGGGDFGIYKWNGTGWTGAAGKGLRIAVDPTGIPWMVNAAGQIFSRTSNNPSIGLWIQRPGLAKDIGIGRDGSVWIVGTDDVGNGNSGIYKWNGAGWTGTDGGGVRIAVGPTGNPWIVNTAGEIYRRTSNGTWDDLPGRGNDVGINEGNYAWLIGANSVGNGDFGVLVWNEQTGIPAPPNADPKGHSGAPERNNWLGVPGGARNIAVGPNARPWIVNSTGQIYRAKK